MKKTITLEVIYAELQAIHKEQAIFRKEQAIFRKEQTTLREGQANSLKEQASFREELTALRNDYAAISARLETGFAQQFGYFERKFNEVNARFDNCATKKDLHWALDLIDAQAKRLDNQEVETAALVSQTRRHDLWIYRFAKGAAKYLNTS